MSKVTLSDVRYNPASGAYEARADIRRDGRTYRYPCSLQGSLMMDDASVVRGLTRQARAMSRRETGLLSIR